MEPQIVFEPSSEGYHNLADHESRLRKAKTYQDLSTICIIPTLGSIPAKVVQNWMGLMSPMNQKFMRVFAIGMEVGAAYTSTIESILSHPELSTWKYVLTLEHDNMPPPDGLLQLYESMETFDVVGGLYWTKGEGGQPMVYGDPTVMPKNFIPQIPQPEAVQAANGLGMGFTLFKLDMFKDERLHRPWFQTVQSYTPGVGVRAYTQDLHFFEDAAKYGYRFASDNRVRVGHYAADTDIIW